MSVEEQTQRKKLGQILEQCVRQIAIRRQRMRASIAAACVSITLGLTGVYFWSQIPGWLHAACVVCLILFPFQVIGYFLDRRILLAHVSAVAELKKVIEKSAREKRESP